MFLAKLKAFLPDGASNQLRSTSPSLGQAGLILLLILLGLLAPASASAQELERTESFVYGVNAAIPDAVIGTFAPPIVDEVYLLADQTSILSPRRTSIYFWPITNEYRASWSRLNEQIEGELEVLQNGSVVATLEQLPYTIHFSAGEGGPRPQLYAGEEAIAADQWFLAEQQAYREAVEAYQAARAAWLEAGNQARLRGDDLETLPPAPEQPEAFDIFSTGLNLGFPIDLEAGSYEIRTRRPDGSIIPESVRDLVVFGPRRIGIGYEVVPERRWTFPEMANAPNDAILTDEGGVIYLKPHVAWEYPAEAYEYLQDPQYKGSGDSSEWTWVSGDPIEESVLEIVRGGQVEAQLPLQPYFVRQNPGREFGYDILPYDPGTPDETPRVDFVGYRVELPADPSAYEVRLRSLDDELLVGSSRQVRVVGDSSSLPSLLLIALIPLFFGAALIFWRRRRTALNKAES